MVEHVYFKTIEQDWAGYSTSVLFSHSFFSEEVTIFLGPAYDEEGEEVEVPPTEVELTEMAQTYQLFVENIDLYLKAIQERAYEYYRAYYAHYYEDEAESGEPPLGIDAIEKHNPHIRELLYIRLLAGGIIILPIRYALDNEHGLEFRFTNGEITDVGGIDDTD
ncbi:hypothetical protein [Myroides phaeus]|uniref:DUF2004 domain-containing protein n=1 Tax=Myroides phaeus TaxID=702745 RepID=A0A1G8CDV6_9FLAO|nr:hypothetical protein [Myroides phaeus]MEC4116297.1 hypothetical protein [Myroides phaeus]SDH43691.1 hypothetical protein SAMN05421818_1041 [Myroides phaeus]